jgi:hypothetical protein
MKAEPLQGVKMITVRDFGDTVEIAVMLPVLEKELGEGISKTGFNYDDLRTLGFTVKIRTRDYIDFIQSAMESFTNFQFARAEVFKSEIDENALH